MVVTSPPAPAADVVWHDLECGAYRADLPLWLELAGQARTRGARVLDIGAGTGRVALELARHAHRVTALDRDARLLAALSERARALPIATVHADARSFALRGPAHDLALMPMQTLQLLRDARERAAAFACAAAHLRAGGLLACAIVTEVDIFDAGRDGAGPVPEQVELPDAHYESRAVRVQVSDAAIRIERDRRIQPRSSSQGATVSRDVVELARVHERQLWDEARAAGLSPEASRTIAETFEHAGSTVVMFRA